MFEGLQKQFFSCFSHLPTNGGRVCSCGMYRNVDFRERFKNFHSLIMTWLEQVKRCRDNKMCEPRPVRKSDVLKWNVFLMESLFEHMDADCATNLCLFSFLSSFTTRKVLRGDPRSHGVSTVDLTHWLHVKSGRMCMQSLCNWRISQNLPAVEEK